MEKDIEKLSEKIKELEYIILRMEGELSNQESAIRGLQTIIADLENHIKWRWKND